MKKVCASELRTAVSIQEEITSPDTAGPGGTTTGGFTTNWVEVASGNAKVEDAKGREEYGTMSRRPVKRSTITLRYNPIITEKMRVVWRGKTGNIVDVANPEERDLWTVLTVEEGTGT